MKLLRNTLVLLFALTLSYSALAENLVPDSDSTRISLLTKQIQLLEFDEQAERYHCEVPCGIFADSLRIDLIREHITTIEKASTQIAELSNQDQVNYNQIVRWVMNKEKHAEEIQHIVSQYFLHQRIKPVNGKNKKASKKYSAQLEHLHHILVYAMKSKQGIDMGNLDKLSKAVTAFEESYFHEH